MTREIIIIAIRTLAEEEQAALESAMELAKAADAGKPVAADAMHDAQEVGFTAMRARWALMKSIGLEPWEFSLLGVLK